jgi:hypothetical protein
VAWLDTNRDGRYEYVVEDTNFGKYDTVRRLG